MASSPIYRLLARCIICKAWWTIPEDSFNGNGPSCPCGGALMVVDMKKHLAALPVAVPPIPIKTK